MKLQTIVAAALLTQSLSAFALTPASADQKLMDSLYKLGVRQNGVKVSAMSSLMLDENGKFTERLGVFFAHIYGSYSLTATDVTVYATDKESYLVMTFASESAGNYTSTRTQIFPVNTEESRDVADYVKAHANAEDHNSSATLKINKYRLKSISCGGVVYPGAETTCSISQ